MREIKFRAWDKTGKRMVGWCDKMFNGETVFNNGILLCEYPLRYANDETCLFSYMQCIGIHDKNGKEIYEGDIVTANWYDYPEPNHTTTGIVEFSQGWMAYWIADYESKVFEEMNGNGCYHWDIEVIGNIYENPELVGGDVNA